MPLEERNAQSDYVLRNIIRKYFKRLSILVTQVPFEIRRLLLLPYMLYNGFKSYIHVDATGRIGFEIHRERSSRISIKSRHIKNRIEEEIFGSLGEKNCIKHERGHDNKIVGLTFTCKDFVEKYGTEVPKSFAGWILPKCEGRGIIEISHESEIKIIEAKIYWMIGNRRFVKYIPFSWLFGNIEYVKKIDPVLNSETDFYSFLFGRLYEIVTRGYEKPVDENVRLMVRQFYMKLIQKVHSEVKNMLFVTQADEQVFQQVLTKYKFFLNPRAKSIESQPTLYGKISRKPDFHVQVGESEHIYVEIEPPFCKPFEGSRPSRRLRGALKQVSDWKKALVQQVAEGEIIRHIVILGLLDDLDNKEKRALQDFNKTQEDLVVVTWDWILKNIDTVKREIVSKLT